MSEAVRVCLRHTSDFYGSIKLKRMEWEHTKSKRAEYDWAVHGTLRTIDPSGSAYVRAGTRNRGWVSDIDHMPSMCHEWRKDTKISKANER
ncbi:hypothetical protein BGZ76_002063 [Entomortierella beljakovae]|nr:hypothetical protein BGZ76_002063 [Entomortierella beljakovae]